MDFEEFRRRAQEAFDAIPREFRERVLGPVCVERTKRQKDGPRMLTLGECVHAPDFAGSPELHSTVFLYYGSFREASRVSPGFDWEAEIVETVRHEVQHHVEDQVGAPKLRDEDWLQDQNERRRAGLDHRPEFWRGGEVLPSQLGGRWAVGADVFVERTLSPDEWDRASREGLRVPIEPAFDGDEPWEAEIDPSEIGTDASSFTIELEDGGRPDHGDGPGDLVLVLRKKRRGFLDLFRRKKA
ncbi:MAG: hypothetical protein HMLKMBBP_00513 [Planctomycetes bacterium]|nr:hypothetical protein [Planctomycetota bacterium]